MKITKNTLKQLIKEELAELQEQRVDREAEADADVRQSIGRAAKHAAHQAERGLSQARAMVDPRYAQKKRAAGYKTIADKAKDDPRASSRAAREEEDKLKMGISATLANMPDADQKEWLADYGDIPIRQQAYKLGMLEQLTKEALKDMIKESFQDVLAEDDTMDPMGADEFSRFANVPGYEDERVPGKTASQVRRRDLPPEEFKYDDSHLRDLGYLEEIIREETEAVLSEDRVLTKLEADLKKYIGRKKKENDAERKATLQKTIDNLKQKIRARKKR